MHELIPVAELLDDLESGEHILRRVIGVADILLGVVYFDLLLVDETVVVEEVVVLGDAFLDVFAVELAAFVSTQVSLAKLNPRLLCSPVLSNV